MAESRYNSPQPLTIASGTAETITEAIIVHQFNESTIQLRTTDGYINLNQMADATGKRIQHWFDNQSTAELLAEFELQQYSSNKLTGIPVSLFEPAIRTIEGRGGGTWAHPDIAIQFAQ